MRIYMRARRDSCVHRECAYIHATTANSQIKWMLMPATHDSLPPVKHPPPPQKSLPKSLYYMVRDFAALWALYKVYPQVEQYGLPGLFVWWNLAGALFPPSCGCCCCGNKQLPLVASLSINHPTHQPTNRPPPHPLPQASSCGASSWWATTAGTPPSPTPSSSTTSVATSATPRSWCPTGPGRR